MPTIFVTSTKENTPCAESIRQELETKGYTCWREPSYPASGDHSYPSVVENALLGSAALVLVWSASAPQDASLERWLLFAQRLKKPIIPVVLDGTTLPTTLLTHISIDGQASSKDIITTLLPLLPALDNKDALVELGEQ